MKHKLLKSSGLMAFLFAAFFGGLMGQNDESCMDLLRKTYEKMNKPEVSLKDGGCYLMECDVRMAPRDSMEVGIMSSSVRYLMDKRSFVFESDQMRCYWDGKQVATFIPGRRVVYLQQASKDHDQKAMEGMAFQLQDSFLVHANVTACREFCLEDGRQGKSIRLEMHGKWAAKFNVMFMTLVVDVEQERFQKISIKHPPGSPAAYTIYEYKAFDYKYAGPAMKGSVKDMLFARGGDLKPEFKNYQLINLNESHAE